MGDHFVLMVDRLIMESTLEAVIEGRSGVQVAEPKEVVVVGGGMAEVGVADEKELCSDGSLKMKVVECRICQEEGEDCSMESPCACSGSLKFAHRKCVQRWCNEKGDTTCEICLQPFKPGYNSPKSHHVPMSFRIYREDLNGPQRMSTFPRDAGISSDYDDYGSPNERNLLLCRVVALTFVTLLVLRHALPILLNEEEYSLVDFSLFAMRIAGIFFPVYVIIQGLSILHTRRRRQMMEDRDLPVAASGGESERDNPMPRPWWRLQLMRTR